MGLDFQPFNATLAIFGQILNFCFDIGQISRVLSAMFDYQRVDKLLYDSPFQLIRLEMFINLSRKLLLLKLVSICKYWAISRLVNGLRTRLNKKCVLLNYNCRLIASIVSSTIINAATPFLLQLTQHLQ